MKQLQQIYSQRTSKDSPRNLNILYDHVYLFIEMKRTDCANNNYISKLCG